MKYLSLILMLFALGCSPVIKPSVQVDTDSFIHADGLREVFRDVIASDGFYMCPKQETVAWIFAGYRRRQRARGLFRWMKKWDCDKFARSFAMYAQEVYMKQSKIETTAESMSIGVYHYIRDDGVGHAVNVIVLDTHMIVWLEPQTGEIWVLSDFEVASSWHQGF